MKTIISVKNLVKNYDSFRRQPGLWGTIKDFFHRQKILIPAVKDISFDIKEGEIVGFLGPNGAGKTTTLKILSGILYPSAGQVYVLGFKPEQRKSDFCNEFAIVMGQKNQLSRNLTPMDNFLLYKEFYSITDQKFTETLNELVDLLDIRSILDIPSRKLSLGQYMKCELVAALIHNPQVLFLDEPTIGLDVVAQKNIRDFIRKYNQKKKTTILLTSHYMDDIKELCERVIIVNFGTIIYDGLLSKLIATYATHKVIVVTATETIAQADLEKYGVVENYQGVRAEILVPREQVKKVAAELITSNLPVDDILIDEMSLDEIIRVIFEARTHAQTV